MLIHAIVTDTDGNLDLNDPAARKRVIEVVQDWKPNVVVGDPLTAFGAGDLNSDKDMLTTARDFGAHRPRRGSDRIPSLIHHARTGKEAKTGAQGRLLKLCSRLQSALWWTRCPIQYGSRWKKTITTSSFSLRANATTPASSKSSLSHVGPSHDVLRLNKKKRRMWLEAKDRVQNGNGKFKQKFRPQGYPGFG